MPRPIETDEKKSVGGTAALLEQGRAGCEAEEQSHDMSRSLAPRNGSLLVWNGNSLSRREVRDESHGQCRRDASANDVSGRLIFPIRILDRHSTVESGPQ